MSDQITKNFTLSEFLESETALRKGIPNTPTPAALKALTECTIPGMQRVRDLLASPIVVSSGYRAPAVNRAVGGSSTSQHCMGEACDFKAPGFGTPLEIARFIVANKAKIGFDQIIQEGAWVHISFVKANPRGQVLTAHFKNGKATYSQGL
jgi:zinc D-Ala-D-Ala carboxypeptidase